MPINIYLYCLLSFSAGLCVWYLFSRFRKKENASGGESFEINDEIFNLIHDSVLETSKASNYEDENELKKQSEVLTKELARIFKAQYCCIGLVEDGYATDYAVTVNGPVTTECEQCLQETQRRRINETLIGAGLNSVERKNWVWSNAEKGGPITNEYAEKVLKIDSETLEGYRKCVLKGEFHNLLLSGIYAHANPDKLIGYILLINKFEDGEIIPEKSFSKDEIKIVQLISDNIALLFHNKELSLRETKDEKEINEWFGINDIDTLLAEILDYLNEEFNSIVASYWTLAENGFSKEEEIIALRAYSIKDKEEYPWIEKYIEENRETGVAKSLSGQIISNSLKEIDGLEQDQIRTFNWKKDNIQIHWEEVPTDYVIGIPIMKATQNPNAEPSKNIWGVICLQPKESIPELEKNIKRLKKFADHVQVLISQAIFRIRYRSIERLSGHLKELTLNIEEQDFYDELTKIIKDTTTSEACTIFLCDKKGEHLYLKSTTATEIVDESGINHVSIDKHQYIEEKIPIYQIKPEPNSITSRVVSKKEGVLVFDLDKCPYTYRAFVEEIGNMHKSIIAYPIFDGGGEAIGVIRCVNKNNDGSPFHAFTQGDLSLLTIIAQIISGYIIYKEYDVQRNNALTHFGHENRSPVSGLQFNLETLDHFINNRLDLKRANLKIRHIKQEIGVIKHNIRNTESIFLDKDSDSVEFSYSLCNMDELLRKIKDLFYYKNPIICNTGNSPKLYVDKNRIHQVFYNLLYNAARYSKKGREIRIFYEKEEYYPYRHKYKVQNYGIGLEEADKEKIFDIPNYRTEAARKLEPSGSGYGLKICKRIMTGHQGEIKVTQLHNPTEFTVYFPEFSDKRKPH